MLAEFEEFAQKGNIITAGDIKAIYDEKCGHKSGAGTIYKLLNRHKWRKVMPRSKHPKKASDEAIDASKKLTFESEIEEFSTSFPQVKFALCFRTKRGSDELTSQSIAGV